MLLIWKESIDGIVQLKCLMKSQFMAWSRLISLNIPLSRSDDKTIISTKFGDGGNALRIFKCFVETGIFGLITFLMLIGIVFFKGIGLYYNLECSESRVYILCSLVALMTYFIHALFNNFLDIDKVSIALWSYIAIIVAVDLRFKKENLNIDSF